VEGHFFVRRRARDILEGLAGPAKGADAPLAAPIPVSGAA
jgi:hypothetical protein